MKIPESLDFTADELREIAILCETAVTVLYVQAGRCSLERVKAINDRVRVLEMIRAKALRGVEGR